MGLNMTLTYMNIIIPALPPVLFFFVLGMDSQSHFVFISISQKWSPSMVDLEDYKGYITNTP